jgi:hypothetical protein
MKELAEFLQSFTGINTWIALAGAALFVFLALFRSVATELVVNMKVPARRATSVVHLFMILVSLITLTALLLAFLDARDARARAHDAQVSRAKALELAEFRKALAQQQQSVRQCIANEEQQVKFTQAFEESGSVRCPGGGCFLESGSCNKREVLVSFGAPGDYFVESYQVVPGDMNDGNVGNVEVVARDTESRATAVRARLWCDPADRPGAGGGWANAKIHGIIRLRDEVEMREQIAATCVAKYPEPVESAN